MKAITVKSPLIRRILDRVFGAVWKNDPKAYNIPGDGTYSVQGLRTMAYFGGRVVERGVKFMGVWFVSQTPF